ncbi:SWET1 protein, partial [Asarcornis scutulata]|nr:SWET1 protein [Asarcornis scutulata]
SNLSWLGYGCLKPDWTLIIVNSIGAALQSLYILVYFYYSPTKVGAGPAGSGGHRGPPTLTAPRCVPQRQVLLKVLMVLALLAAAYGYFTCYFTNEDTRRSHVGLFCSTFTVVMYASPLADLAKVIRSRSTRCLSFPLTVTTFLASSSWTLYGLWLKDPYIMVPNVPGIATSVVRLWLFWRYAPGRDNPYRPLHA